jgi:hypothetical protein
MTADVALWRELEAKPKPRRKGVTVGKIANRVEGELEDDIQTDIVKAIRRLGFRVHAIPNGAFLHGDAIRRARQSQKLTRMGMVDGAGDIAVRLPKARGGPAYGEIEIKRPGGVLSIDQEKRRDELLADGDKWGAACSIDGALDVLRSWGWL